MTIAGAGVHDAARGRFAEAEGEGAGASQAEDPHGGAPGGASPEQSQLEVLASVSARGVSPGGARECLKSGARNPTMTGASVRIHLLSK